MQRIERMPRIASVHRERLRELTKWDFALGIQTSVWRAEPSMPSQRPQWLGRWSHLALADAIRSIRSIRCMLFGPLPLTILVSGTMLWGATLLA